MRFPISGILMVAIGGICMFLYICFNYAFREMRVQLWESANKTMSGERLSQFGELMPQLTDGFGIACVMCFGIAILIFIVDSLSGPRSEV